MKILLRTPIAFLSILSVLILSGCSGFGPVQNSAVPRAAQALPDQQRVQRHVYLGTGIGASRLNPDTSEVQTHDVNDRVNGGGQITLGMDLSRQLAVELHSADLGSAGISPSGRINYHLHGVSALIYAGKNRHKFKRRGLSGYGRVGLGVLDNSSVGEVPYRQDNGSHILFGAGMEYMTKLGLGLRAEVISYEEDVQYGQLAMVYRLGNKRRDENFEVAELPPEEPLVGAALTEPSQCSLSAGLRSAVLFSIDSSGLTADGKEVLQQASEKLNECKNLTVTLSAHTDSSGSISYNQALSERRAASTAEYLRGQGIDESQLIAESFGETRPSASNATVTGRKLNRRVEMFIQ